MEWATNKRRRESNGAQCTFDSRILQGFDYGCRAKRIASKITWKVKRKSVELVL